MPKAPVDYMRYPLIKADGVNPNAPVSFELDALHELIVLLADVFVYVGIAFAIFASILLSNFIATSISYKGTSPTIP